MRELLALEEEYPDLDHPRLAQPQVGVAPSATFAPVVHAVPMMSLDNAMDADELRGLGRRLHPPAGRAGRRGRRRRASCASSRSTAWPCRSATRAGGWCRPPPAATGAPARTSPPTSAPSTCCPSGCPAGAPRGARGAGRDLHAHRRPSRRSTATWPSRAAALRQPAQHGRRLAAPEGPGHHRLPPAHVLELPAGPGRGGPASPPTTRRWSGCAELGFPVNPEIRRLDQPRRGVRHLPALAGAPPRPRLRDRRRGGQGRRPRPAQRARLHHQGAALGHRLQVPARGAHHPAAGHHVSHRAHRPGHARSPCSSRSSSAGSTVGPGHPPQPGPGRRPRTCARATRSSCARPAT